MKKIIVIVFAPLAAALLAAAPVAATELLAYHLLLWEVPGGKADPFGPDQILVEDLPTDVASIDLLDGSSAIRCGTTYQADLEWNSPTTDALVAIGLLHDPNDPQEDHAYGALGDGVNPWKLWTTPDCVQPPDEVTPGSSEVKDCKANRWVISNWHDTVTYVGDAHGYIAQPAVRTIDPDTYRDATALECPPELALTGLSDDQLGVASGATLVLFVLGYLALLWKRTQTP